ncbi:MAG: hypothetical protein ACK5RO_03580 [Pseudobdellovibrionaceae bacterium]|jgi:hypothetical protein
MFDYAWPIGHHDDDGLAPALESCSNVAKVRLDVIESVFTLLFEI